MTEETTTERFEVPEWNFVRLTEEIERLNKRARKLRVAEISINEISTYTRVGEWASDRDGNRRVRFTTDSGFKGESVFSITYHVIEINGETPRFAGWTFVSTAERIEDEVFLATLPGETVPVAFRDAAVALDCDHCGHDRRRNRTFVLRHDSGDHKRVGSTCIKDFLGHTNPLTLARRAEWLAALRDIAVSGEDERWREGNFTPTAYDTEVFLTAVAAEIRVNGFLSKATAWDMDRLEAATASVAWDFVLGPPNGGDETDSRKWFEGHVVPTDADGAKAVEVLAWIREHFAARDADSLNDYEHNMRVVTVAEFLRAKHAGFAASAFGYFDRAMERERETSERAAAWGEKKSSVHLGSVKERLELTVTIDGLRSFDGDYGVSTLHKMTTNNGDAVAWFASGGPKMDVGSSYVIKGTVKKHAAFRGVLETNLARVKVVEELAA